MEEVFDNRLETPNGTVIAVRDLVKRFPVGDGEVTVLEDISFLVRQGEYVSIVGPSGSGKSTLLNMITGIDRPSTGEVEVAGTRIDIMRESKLAQWRGANLGLVFQFYQLLPALTLIDNVVLPMDFAGRYRPRERRERAMQLLELVGLAEHAFKLPGAVSGGQQQRTAIARAMANDPPLLVCDEPTGNLDTVSAEQMFGLFWRLVEDGKTVVMVTHNRDLAGRTPRVIELIDGKMERDQRLTELTL